MKVFLVDGTYELFRHYYGRPPHLTKDLREVGAVQGVLGSVLQLFESGATHVGVATDHVIESFRNELYEGYKTGDGIDPDLLSQFRLLEDSLSAMGVRVWPMIELEADDALASVAEVASDDEAVEQVAIMTPDKDLAQCVVDGRIVQVDRRNNKVFDEAAVLAKFGVLPSSIPDYLALVGDSSDGYPGLTGWGSKSTAAVLRRYLTIENIPDRLADWDVTVRGAAALASTLEMRREEAMLYKELATLRVDRSLLSSVDELRWQGPTDGFDEVSRSIEAPSLIERCERLDHQIDGSR